MKKLYLVCLLLVGCLSNSTNPKTSGQNYPVAYTGTDGLYIASSGLPYGNTSRTFENVKVTVYRNDSLFSCREDILSGEAKGGFDTIQTGIFHAIYENNTNESFALQISEHTMILTEANKSQGIDSVGNIIVLSRIIKTSR